MAIQQGRGKPQGNIIGWFLNSTFPPIFIGLALLLGVVALILTPREEDPQIIVPMADVMVTAPGLSARQVANAGHGTA